jgi:hypothetical protein
VILDKKIRQPNHYKGRRDRRQRNRARGLL